MIKAIIFDFDGVIAESTDVKTRAFRKLFENEGEAVAESVERYHKENQGVSRFEKFRYIYTEILKRDLCESEYINLCDAFSQLVKDDVIRAPLVKGALDFLKRYSSRYLFFVASATPQEEMKTIISAKGLTCYFKDVYGAPRRKGDMVNSIKKQYGFLSNEVVYVGDAWSDFEAAKSNMVHFVARVTRDIDVFRDLTCERLADLTELKRIVDSIERSL